jgi:hypothetical protein
MATNKPSSFKAEINIIGINPFVFIPDKILEKIFKQAGKQKGAIPVKGLVNNKAYRQTLVRYNNAWRLYINTTMLKDSPKRIGEIITVEIIFDHEPRDIETPSLFAKALKANKTANAVFESLSPSLQKEIIRYLARLKTQQSLEENTRRAIQFLLGKERFIGRELPQPTE